MRKKFSLKLNVYISILDFPLHTLSQSENLKPTFTLIFQLLGVQRPKNPCKCFKAEKSCVKAVLWG